MIALVMALAATQVSLGDTAPPTLTDAEFCEGGQKAVEGLQATYPRQVDAITRIETVTIDCQARTMEWNGSVSVPLAEMRPGWMTERQTAWNATSCRNASLLAARLGWHFRQTYRFKDGTFSSIDAACP